MCAFVHGSIVDYYTRDSSPFRLILAYVRNQHFWIFPFWNVLKTSQLLDKVVGLLKLRALDERVFIDTLKRWLRLMSWALKVWYYVGWLESVKCTSSSEEIKFVYNSTIYLVLWHEKYFLGFLFFTFKSNPISTKKKEEVMLNQRLEMHSQREKRVDFLRILNY